MRLSAALMVLTVSAMVRLVAMPQAPTPGPPAAPQSAQAATPIDLTGYWVSVVNEDWRWRMVTPPKGDYASVPLNAEGRKAADSWTPALDGRCEAYGAAGLMRMPTRVRITWQDQFTLKLESDAGAQTRMLRFAAPSGNNASSLASGLPADAQSAKAAARSLQGDSLASWQLAGPRGGGFGGFGFAPPAGAGGRGGPRFGSLRVVTTNLLPGWLRRNGVPYSSDTVVTEHFDRFTSTNGDEWFVVTTVVADPKYLQQEYITSSHFKKELDGSKWSPMPCK
jgi:hypothetical protein